MTSRLLKRMWGLAERTKPGGMWHYFYAYPVRETLDVLYRSRCGSVFLRKIENLKRYKPKEPNICRRCVDHINKDDKTKRIKTSRKFRTL